jgi:hypothetical protein
MLLLASSARAQSEAALAESLFEEGRALMDAEKYADACPKLAESQRLDPALGTLLNLALCNERLGKNATAWAQYREALAIASRSSDPRADFARDHIQGLEPKLSRLTVAVSTRTSGLAIRLDGVALSQAAWGTAVPVDPGEHRVEASAPGHESWSTTVSIGAAAASERIDVPALTPSAAPSVPPIQPAPSVQPAAPVSQTSPPREPEPSSPRTAGYIVGGAGVVALGVGTYFGIRALDLNSQAKDKCPTDDTCVDDGAELSDEALTSSRIATVAIGLGVVGVGVGAYLVLSAPSGEPAAALSTAWLPGGGALRLSGRF